MNETTPVSSPPPPAPPVGASARESDEEQDSVGRYVSFFLGGESFAFPMDVVVEVIRVPESVAVPLTPPSLVGLANLRGSVLPILDLRQMMGLPRAKTSDATRVVVTDCGQRVGLVVDQISRVLNVDAHQIEDTRGLQSTLSSQLLSGVVKGDNGALIQLVSVEQLFEESFSILKVASRRANNSAVETTKQAKEQEEETGSQLVSFLVDGQEYAFEIAAVQEIVRVPKTINAVPQSGPSVLGLINLRSQLLPLVSLRQIFGMPRGTLEDRNRIVVLRIGGAQAIGVLVDQVREVLWVSEDVQEALPALLRPSNGQELLTSICRLEGGKRLVSVLSSTTFFSSPNIQAALAAHGASDAPSEDAAMQRDTEVTQDEETQLVVFHLNGEEYGVPVESVQEIVRVSKEMRRVPKAHHSLQGIVNLRGTILPVMDLRLRFGLQQAERNDRQRILVLALGGARTGFVVDSVTEVLRLPKSVIEVSPTLSSDQARLFGRIANLRRENRMIMVLSPDQLLDAQEREAIQQALHARKEVA